MYVNNELLRSEVSKKETKIQTRKKDNALLAMKTTELEEEVEENQIQFDIILTAARSRSRRAGAPGPRPGLLSSLTGEAGAGGFKPNPAQSPHQPPSPPHCQPQPAVSSITREPPVPSPLTRPAAVRPRPQENNNVSDVLIAMVVAKLPDLKEEEAVNYIQIPREKNRDKLNSNDILTGVEELWKKSLGAVGGQAGPVAFGRGRRARGKIRGRPVEAGPVEEDEEDECSICLDPLMPGDPDYKELKPCQHWFHLHCIQVNSGPVSDFLSLVYLYIGLDQH